MGRGSPSAKAKHRLAGCLELWVHQSEPDKDSTCFISVCATGICGSVNKPLPANREGCFQKHLVEQNVTGRAVLFLDWLARGAPSAPSLPTAVTRLRRGPGFGREQRGALLLLSQRYGCPELTEVFPSSRSAPTVQILAAEFMGSSHPVATRAVLLLP